MSAWSAHRTQSCDQAKCRYCKEGNYPIRGKQEEKPSKLSSKAQVALAMLTAFGLHGTMGRK